MDPIKVGVLMAKLQGLINNHSLDPMFQVCVWVKDGSGYRAIAITDMFPDVDWNEEMVAFKLEYHNA